MSRVTRRKHVLKEMMEDDFDLPKENQQIVRVISTCGNNLLQVEDATDSGSEFLVSMPTKFRKNVWVKRGDCLLVEPIEEGDKVKAEICKILTPEHVKEYTKAGVWPKKFTKKREHSAEHLSDEEDDGGDAFMVRNLNRPQVDDDDNETSDETESSDEE